MRSVALFVLHRRAHAGDGVGIGAGHLLDQSRDLLAGERLDVDLELVRFGEVGRVLHGGVERASQRLDPRRRHIGRQKERAAIFQPRQHQPQGRAFGIGLGLVHEQRHVSELGTLRQRPLGQNADLFLRDPVRADRLERRPIGDGAVRLAAFHREVDLRSAFVTRDESTPKIHLAMESGEAHGTIANWSTLKAISTNWITEKKIRILAQWALTKSPELADVPLFMDQAKTDAERAALRLMLARLEYGRPFFLPPNVPAARVQALRRAFDATMKDPAYLAEADKLKIDVEPLSGEQVAALVEQVSRTDPDTVARVRAAMENK